MILASAIKYKYNREEKNPFGTNMISEDLFLKFH